MKAHLKFISEKDYKQSYNTLINLFLHEKMKGYNEPQRKGTPRGELIGFPAKKYLVTLLMLLNVKQKDIAQELHISYGVLRKWKTEEAFKKMVVQHCDEFVQRLIDHILSKSRAEIQQYEDWLAGKYNDPCFERYLIYEEDPALLDINNYANCIHEKLNNIYETRANQIKNNSELEALFGEWMTIQNAIYGTNTYNEMFGKEGRGALTKLFIEESKEILSKDNLTIQDKRKLQRNVAWFEVMLRDGKKVI
jgi:hypothetical protein